MADKKITPLQDPKETKAAQAAPDPEREKEKTTAAEEMRHIKLTAAGDPLPINPDTGEIDIDKLTDEQRAELEAASEIIKEAIKKVLPSVPPAFKSFIEKNLNIANTFSKTTIVGEKLNEFIQTIHTILQPIEELHKELNELKPYLIEELAKPGYKGKTFDYLIKYEPRELVELRNDPESFLSKAIDAARKEQKKQELKEGKQERQLRKQNAEAAGAIMKLTGGTFLNFSNDDLWNAFAPGRICKMGTLNGDFIDKETGLVTKDRFRQGEIIPLKSADISYHAFILLNSILANSVENIRNDKLKGGVVKFYVKGVLDQFTNDPRTLIDGQIAMDLDNPSEPLSRKTAGALYLENLFAPLQGYLGLLPNGSRYSVFNYIGYDYESDTMEVALPYLYELWKPTQAEYFYNIENKNIAIANSKKPKKKDYTPLKVNSLFKNKAFNFDEIILEIAYYITNTILQAGGKKGQTKKTVISYKTMLKFCPRFNDKIEEIRTGKIDNKEIKNPSARLNTELKKIAKAIDLILDPANCDFAEKYDLLDLKPAKVVKNKRTNDEKIVFTPPTNKTLENGKITIVWSKKEDTDLI